MAQQQDNLKIKKQLPVVKLDKKDQQTQERLSRWLEAQSNYSLSIITLIENMIDRFGYVDITNHEVLKKLYTEKLYYENDLKSPENQNIKSSNNLESIKVAKEENKENMKNDTEMKTEINNILVKDSNTVPNNDNKNNSNFNDDDDELDPEAF